MHSDWCLFFSLLLQNLEEKDKKNLVQRDQLSRKHLSLKRRLEQLHTCSNAVDINALYKRRSVSECSSSTISSISSISSLSTGSPSSISESGKHIKLITFPYYTSNSMHIYVSVLLFDWLMLCLNLKWISWAGY